MKSFQVISKTYCGCILVLALASCSVQTTKSTYVATAIPEKLQLNASEVTEEPVIATVLRRLGSNQKVFIFPKNEPEAWSGQDKTYLSTGILKLIESNSALCFILAHELAHLILHQRADQHSVEQRELEADAYALPKCISIGYSGFAATTFLQDLARTNTIPAHQALLSFRAQQLLYRSAQIFYQPVDGYSADLAALKRRWQ